MNVPICICRSGVDCRVMNGRKVVLPYDATAERMLTRVTFMRFGVPERVLNEYIPVDSS